MLTFPTWTHVAKFSSSLSVSLFLTHTEAHTTLWKVMSFHSLFFNARSSNKAPDLFSVLSDYLWNEGRKEGMDSLNDIWDVQVATISSGDQFRWTTCLEADSESGERLTNGEMSALEPGLLSCARVRQPLSWCHFTEYEEAHGRQECPLSPPMTDDTSLWDAVTCFSAYLSMTIRSQVSQERVKVAHWLRDSI